MSQFGLFLLQAVELSHSDIKTTFLNTLGVNDQSVHFQSKCPGGCSVQVDFHPVDIPFGSKCPVDLLVVDVLSRH
jgi:hypothetical protein